MKVGLGVHVVDTINAVAYLNHLPAVAGWAKKHEMAFVGARRLKVAAARNLIVDELLKLGCTHWLSLDDDHLVPDNMLDLLVENADAGMVSGLICKRGFPYEIVAFKDVEGMRSVTMRPDTGVKTVSVCAMGCTLINLEPLKDGRIARPWFEDTREHRSDVNFCAKMRDVGMAIKVDTRVCVGHLCEPRVITPQVAEAWRKNHIDVLTDETGEVADARV